MKLYKRVSDRDAYIRGLPTGYRVAWREENWRGAVAFPIGLHWIARWVNWIWRWSYAYRGDRWEQALWDAEERGREEGRTNERHHMDRMARLLRENDIVYIDKAGELDQDPK